MVAWAVALRVNHTAWKAAFLASQTYLIPGNAVGPRIVTGVRGLSPQVWTVSGCGREAVVEFFTIRFGRVFAIWLTAAMPTMIRQGPVGFFSAF
jgi:hypothetical protein